jgi:hypothetical protein
LLTTVVVLGACLSKKHTNNALDQFRDLPHHCTGSPSGSAPWPSDERCQATITITSGLKVAAGLADAMHAKNKRQTPFNLFQAMGA